MGQWADRPIMILTYGVLDVRWRRRDHRWNRRLKPDRNMEGHSSEFYFIKIDVYIQSMSMICTTDVCIFGAPLFFTVLLPNRPAGTTHKTASTSPLRPAEIGNCGSRRRLQDWARPALERAHEGRSIHYGVPYGSTYISSDVRCYILRMIG